MRIKMRHVRGNFNFYRCFKLAIRAFLSRMYTITCFISILIIYDYSSRSVNLFSQVMYFCSHALEVVMARVASFFPTPFYMSMLLALFHSSFLIELRMRVMMSFFALLLLMTGRFFKIMAFIN